MSGSPVPVPSKAAIRALRGLLLGTSCTLALIVEDRRRRIDTVRTAIRNSDRIKSRKQYHTGSTALRLALADEGLLESPAIQWKSHDVSSAARSQHARPAGYSTEPRDAARTSLAADLACDDALATLPSSFRPPTSVLPGAFIRPLSEQIPSLGRVAATDTAGRAELESSKDADFRDVESMVSRIRDLSSQGDSAGIGAAVSLLRNAIGSQKVELFHASAQLCRMCLDLGLTSEAQKILELVVQAGQVDEELYYAHNPWPIIESLIPSGSVESIGRRAFLEQLHKATALFLPARSVQAKSNPPELVDVGRKLLECAFEVRCRRSIEEVYQRIVASPEDISELLSWYFTRLLETEDHDLIIRSFQAHSPERHLSETLFYTMGDVVVEAVEQSRGLKADLVLRRLVALDSGRYRLRTSWAAKLLFSHWQKHRNYQKPRPCSMSCLRAVFPTG